MTDIFNTSRPGLKRRHAAERRFRLYGQLSITIALGFLVIMIGVIGYQSVGAFSQTQIALSVQIDETVIDPGGMRDPASIQQANYGSLIKASLRAAFPGTTTRRDKRKLYGLVSSDAEFALRNQVIENPAFVGTTEKFWFVASDDVDMLVKGNVDVSLPEDSRRVSDMEVEWIEKLQSAGDIKRVANVSFFTSGDSREPELAGILSALMGSALSLSVCFVLSFPVGILAAIYLEEFAPKNRWSDIIEININNLAAVPSIVFGLLGLAIFLNFFGLPRSTPLVGGMVLALMTLPTIIIAARVSLRAVPPSIREAALALGASRLQATFQQVVTLALPGMLTGTIVGMARALGDTAPLLLIGMVAFIVDVPTSILQPATALPVQVFLWADSPERGFLEKTSAAIIVLLVFLVLMNLTAVLLRRKFARRF